jgi:Family of unknown function (DUF5906)
MNQDEAKKIAAEMLAEKQGVSLDDFHAFMPMHSFIFAPTREMWPATSVNARIPPIMDGEQKQITATQWLDRNRHVEQMTWSPGKPMLIHDHVISDGGWIEHEGVTCFNLYRPPVIKMGDAAQADRWVEHVHRVYPNDAEHLIQYFAHRVQRPSEKINHAIVLGGSPGIGKDSLLEPVKHAVGPWNFAEVSPKQVLGKYNAFIKSIVLRISEARDLGDFDRYGFYDHMKSVIAAPPDVLRVDEKHLREHAVVNVTSVIITTNHLSDGIYLPADDRRHFVAWSELTRDDFFIDYWNDLWNWYGSGGFENVAAYLKTLDLSAFDPKAPPPKTPAFWAIVDASRAPEDAELADALDLVGNPAAVTIDQVVAQAGAEFATFLRDRRNSRKIPHRFEGCGYVPVRNDEAKDGLWKIGGRRQVIYAKSSLTVRDRIVRR